MTDKIIEKCFWTPELGHWVEVGEEAGSDLPPSAKEISLPPSSNHKYNGESWVYTPVGIEEIRNSVSITRERFCISLFDQGILNEDETVKASQGEWPSSFSGMFETMTKKEAVMAKVKFASNVWINRTDSLVEMVANYANLNPFEVDTIFDIDSPEKS